MTVNLISYSKRHVLVEVKETRYCSDVWFACGIYGWAERSHKLKTWDLPKKSREDVRGFMIVFGDFNEILNLDEKERGGVMQDRDMMAFRDFLDEYGFRDLGFRGSSFTWSRGSSRSTMIRECLDRFVACSEWQNTFQSFDIRHFPVYWSDHAPIILHPSRPQDAGCCERWFSF